MKTNIIIRKTPVEADVVVDVTHNDLDGRLEEELKRFKARNPDVEINSVIFAVTKVIPQDTLQPMMSAAFWFRTDTLVIADVGNLLFGGILETPNNATPVMVGDKPLTNHVMLWKRNSYTSSYDLNMDFMYRELICNYFRQLINDIVLTDNSDTDCQ